MRNFGTVNVLFLVGSLCLPGCILKSKSSSDSKQTAPAQVVYDLSKISDRPDRDFIDGLLAEAGSPERKRAGRILENILQTNYALFTADNPNTKQGQELTKKIFKYTTDYLQADKAAQCLQSQKVRVYRGITVLPVIHSSKSPQRHLHLFNDWSTLLLNDLGLIKSIPADSGSVVYSKRDNLKSSSITALPWAHYLGFQRLIGKARRPDDFINLDWQALAVTHTVSSNGSPLLSTSLQPDVVDGLNFGPAFIVADVCPERALTLRSTFAFGEAEVYVPFFLLPEEIVRIEGADCGHRVYRQASKKDQCWKNPLTDTDARTPMSDVYRNCYVNFGFPVEYRHYSQSARAIVLERSFSNLNAMQNIEDTSTSVDALRTKLLDLKTQCQPNCGVAQKVIEGARADIARRTSENRPEDTAETEKLKNDLVQYESALKSLCAGK